MNRRTQQRLGRLSRTIRVGLADDHSAVRMGYRRLLELDPVLEVVAEYADAGQVWEGLTRAHQPDQVDMLILDLSMPGRSGADLLVDLQQAVPELVIVVMTMHDVPAMRARCLRQGAAAFVSKSDDPAVLLDVVRSLRMGHALPGPAADKPGQLPHHRLTMREFDVLCLLLKGWSVEAIALHLNLSEKTVWNNQTLIRQKLGVSSSMELLQYALNNGLSA